MSPEKRRLISVWSITCDRDKAPPGKVLVSVRGETPHGKTGEFVFEMSFSQWCCVVREFARSWKTEREQRISEIDHVNAALPENQR